VDVEQYRIMFDVEQAHWWYRGMRRNARAILARYLAPGRAYAILDAGCGTGGTTEDLAAFGVVTGVDMSEDALTFAATRGLRRLVRGTVQQLPFPSQSFDVVTSFDVIYHRAVGDVVGALTEFHRVLRPGGIALVRVPAFDWLRGAHDVAVHTERRFTVGELRDAMTKAGFGIAYANYGNALLFPLAIAKRSLERILPYSPGDLSVPPAPLNFVLEQALVAEAPVAARVGLPAGLSAIVVGRA
jgi:ubiquinone/menaquinone biosynthesis C-methylase UbiE